MDHATQEAIGLLERLRVLAKTWPYARPPSLSQLDGTGMFEKTLSTPAESEAMRALMRASYYGARERTEWLARLDEALRTLRETK